MSNSTRTMRACSMLAVFVAAAASIAAVKFTSTWAAPDAAGVTFKGQKVVALVMSDDMSLRMSAEEALSRELSARGMQGVAAYRMIPSQELKETERAKAWFEREAVAGVVALRPVSQDRVKRYGPEVWSGPSYSTLWGFYPYGWTTVYVVGSNRTDTIIVVESLIYKVSTGKLVWAGASEATNPESLQALVADIVKEAAEKIRKQFK
jgi:hypothetical protein